MRRVLKEAASHGPVTPQSLRDADQRLRSRKLIKRRRLLADPGTWGAIAGLGGIGLAVESVFATVHPFAVGSVVGVASWATVAASGIVGGWIAKNFGKNSQAGER